MTCDKCNREQKTKKVTLKSSERLSLCADCEWEAANLGATLEPK